MKTAISTEITGFFSTFLFFLSICILITACASGPSPEETGSVTVKSVSITEEPRFEVKYEAVGLLLLEWEDAVRTKDHNRFNKLLWPDSILRLTDRNGRNTDFYGIDAIREFRLEFFTELGPLSGYSLSDNSMYKDRNDTWQTYFFSFDDKMMGTGFQIQRREGEWRIQNISLELFPIGSWVTNRFQALSDIDGDGFIKGGHEDDLAVSMFTDFLEGPHNAAGPLDELLDGDRDGYISEGEIISFREAAFSEGIRWFRDFDRDWALAYLDLTGNGEIIDNELELISDFMTGSKDVEESADAENDLEKWIDINDDGSTDRFEIAEARKHFINMLVHTPCPDAVFLPVPRDISNYLDELADGNGDGRIDWKEQEIILNSLPYRRSVGNYLEMALDLQHDGTLDHTDVLLAFQASAQGKSIIADKAEPPYRVITLVDAHFDSSDDGFIDQEEIDTVTAFLAGDIKAADKVKRILRDLTDWNGDGEIEHWEIEEAGALILRPHPASMDESLDRDGDVNGDGFIDPEELGITAGITGKGEAPTFDERIDLLRNRIAALEMEKPALDTSPDTTGETTAEESAAVDTDAADSADPDTSAGFQSEYYHRLGKIQDRKLAIVSFDAQTSYVDDETAKGIIVFVENAFVNVGKVRVVDRKHIEEIQKENKFQASGMVDEDTAIELGKLSGADIIVIGSINRVGGVFYLNIKLIDVESAEIIGSNIALAKDETEFLDMCNQVVYMLF